VERQSLTELRAGLPLRVADLTIVPLERRDVTVACDAGRLFATARNGPGGVVFLDGRGAWALDESGRPLDLEDLANRAVGLREILHRNGV